MQKIYKIRFLLALVLLITAFVGSYSIKMQIDASADTLLLDGDKDLKFIKKINKRYATSSSLIVTFSPLKKDLLDDDVLNIIKRLSKSLESLEFVHNVTSILTVPLLQSPPIGLAQLAQELPTLNDKNVNKVLAKKEFTTSPLYANNLVSVDFTTTALVLNIQNIQTKEQNHNNIVKIRKILEEYRQYATINLGGIDMIADDLITFVKSDLNVFSIAVFLIIILVLSILFRNIVWVILPIFISFVAIATTTGLLGFFGWKITVISSNFISLQLIMTMSLVIHLIIKYKELIINNDQYTQDELVSKTVKAMIQPSFFVVLTTIAGFSSLVFSDILPVISFGYMMSLALIISFVLTFVLFYLIVQTLSRIESVQQSNDGRITSKIANIVLRKQKAIFVTSILVALFSITGANKLIVENSFIDYFKKDTDIYKGMKTIDDKLGGTTPLDIIITFHKNQNDDINTNEDDTQEDNFDDEFGNSEDDEKYWFTREKLKKIKKVHNYLESLPEIGKVLSLSTLDEIGKILNNGEYLDGLKLAILSQKIPPEYKRTLLDPYVNIPANQIRITTRIIDSMPDLRRKKLIEKIQNDIGDILNPKTEEFRLSNLLILYNNMLQSLFDSQIKTLGIVVLILFFMFWILFRSFYVAILSLIANIVPVGVIFGLMGHSAIPLDMMTITIAAISIGIAVDDTIHYVHRFKLELDIHNDYKTAMLNTHKSIGTAMFYTSVVIMIGFFILVLSNFIPTIYFGLLTLTAMFMAIVSDLFLLPALLLRFKPFTKKR